jgi:hypothetical protein
MPNPLADLIHSIVPQLPLIVAYLVGMVICAMRWNRYPRPAQLAFLGTAFLVIDFLVQPTVRVFLVDRLEPSAASDMLSMLTLISAIVRLTGYGFLLGAVFIARSVTAPPRSSPSGRKPS